MATSENDELIFEVTQEADGGFVAECSTESIVTQGDTWDELRISKQLSHSTSTRKSRCQFDFILSAMSSTR